MEQEALTCLQIICLKNKNKKKYESINQSCAVILDITCGHKKETSTSIGRAILLA